MTRIAVLGAGSWGTTFATVLAAAGNDVVVWARRAEVAREISREHRNRAYLGERELSERITGTADIASALAGVAGVFVAIPAQQLRATLEGWRDRLPDGLPAVPVVSLTKGIEHGTTCRMSELLTTVGGLAPEHALVLSGPNLSGEIAAGQPCASVVAGLDEAIAHRVAGWCTGPAFRSYVSSDVRGVEVAGAVKNVIAIAVGAAAGLGYGDNTRASLITRGLAEITRLGVDLGGERSTFAGLAGLGDLVATCASPLSRNHRLGAALGRGLDLPAAIVEVGQTAEGVATARAVVEVADRRGVEVPIARGVVDVVDGTRSITEVTTALLTRPVRAE